jgi:hypothetical protein
MSQKTNLGQNHAIFRSVVERTTILTIWTEFYTWGVCTAVERERKNLGVHANELTAKEALKPRSTNHALLNRLKN